MNTVGKEILDKGASNCARTETSRSSDMAAQRARRSRKQRARASRSPRLRRIHRAFAAPAMPPQLPAAASSLNQFRLRSTLAAVSGTPAESGCASVRACRRSKSRHIITLAHDNRAHNVYEQSGARRFLALLRASAAQTESEGCTEGCQAARRKPEGKQGARKQRPYPRMPTCETRLLARTRSARSKACCLPRTLHVERYSRKAATASAPRRATANKCAESTRAIQVPHLLSDMRPWNQPQCPEQVSRYYGARRPDWQPRAKQGTGDAKAADANLRFLDCRTEPGGRPGGACEGGRWDRRRRRQILHGGLAPSGIRVGVSRPGHAAATTATHKERDVPAG